MHRPVLLAFAAAIVLTPLLLCANVAHASGTPAQVCAGAKLKAAGKTAGLKLGCHGKAALHGTTVDSTCLANATAKLSSAFAKAESRGGCNPTGDVNGVGALIDSSVGAFVAALRPTTSANRCAASKLKATGKKVKTKLRCWAKATGKGVTVDPQCLTKAETRFASAFSSADAHGPCLTTGDAGGIESQVDDLVNDVVAALPSGTATTTTTTTSSTSTTAVAPTCGNGVVEGSEQCDGGSVPICATSGRSGCFPAGGPDECKCCTLPGEIAQIALSGQNACCDGSSPQPAGPNFYSCQGTCGSTPFPTCGGSCLPGMICAPVRIPVSDLCACVPPDPCGGTSPSCTGAECPAGQACDSSTCSCFIP
jgi:hypothetical protein